MTSDITAILAPTGVLRAGINLSNFLLVSGGRNPSGVPIGVSPDLAAALAERLGVSVSYVCYEKPDLLADAVDTGVWDVGLLANEPARASKIAFTKAYSEIEATYLLRRDSSFKHAREVDTAGTRIIVAAGTAYGLWLEANIKHAELISVKGDDATKRFVDEKLDVLASLKPRLLKDVELIPGTRIVEGNFTTIMQSVGVPKQRDAAIPFLQKFVEEAKTSGLVARLIEKHKVQGLSVAAV